jgi:hypothetical protein
MQITLDSADVVQMITNAPRQIAQANRAAIYDITSLIARDLKTYPAQRPPANPNRPYRRTRTLGRSWQKNVEARGANVIGRVRSSGQIAPYNRWVQDELMQAWMHRGHWSNTLQAVGRARRTTEQEIWRRRLRQFVGK